LFDLGGEFADQGRDLFFGLDADQQLAMFTDLNAPEQVGENLQSVIRGIYTYLELEPEDGDQHDELLQVMADDLEQIKDAYPDSRILCGEIRAWLRGRKHFQGGKSQDAIDAYTQAINYNGQNPATHLDRALAYTRVDQCHNALVDLSRVIELDSGRQEQVIGLVQSTPALRDYLASHQTDFPVLAESVK
jgi:tetratricopeptide (TPR) repeat protein